METRACACTYVYSLSPFPLLLTPNKNLVLLGKLSRYAINLSFSVGLLRKND